MLTNKKLKILFVLQTSWGTQLGMSRVHYELKKAYEDKMLYPKIKRGWYHFLGKSTQTRIWEYLKIHATKYDVIDANQRCIPYPKESYGFNGVVLFRSHGLPPLYTLAENQPLFQKLIFKKMSHANTLNTRLGAVKRTLMHGLFGIAFVTPTLCIH